MRKRDLEFRKVTFPRWNEMLEDIFREFIPYRAEWRKIDDIIGILATISQYQRKYRNLNHLFFPHGGGLDLTGVKRALEKDCIELDFDGLTYICKPESLSFHAINYNPDWMYFRLDCSRLQPSGVYELAENDIREFLTEVMPGVYDNPDIWDYGYYDYGSGEEPLRKEARRVTRILRGSMVIFCKASLYNLITSDKFDAYNAVHNKMNREEFEEFIKEFAEYVDKKEDPQTHIDDILEA